MQSKTSVKGEGGDGWMDGWWADARRFIGSEQNATDLMDGVSMTQSINDLTDMIQ